VNPLLDLDARPVIGHRGASGHAPENTLPSFALALAQGADALELDVHLTADGTPVVLHDATLDRTTDRRGPVAALALGAVQEADAGARFTADGVTFPYRGAGIRVPTLAEVLRAFPGVPLLVELKVREAQEAVGRVLLEEQAADRCVMAADDGGAIEVFRRAPFVAGACRGDIARLFFGHRFGAAPRRPGYRLLSVPEYHRGLLVASRGFVAAARARGAPVHVWTVNDAARARRLWERGVAGIVTNYPDRIVAARAEM
jgi:glycerophosphoryl diester phosphodiesterase